MILNWINHNWFSFFLKFWQAHLQNTILIANLRERVLGWIANQHLALLNCHGFTIVIVIVFFRAIIDDRGNSRQARLDQLISDAINNWEHWFIKYVHDHYYQRCRKRDQDPSTYRCCRTRGPLRLDSVHGVSNAANKKDINIIFHVLQCTKRQDHQHPSGLR